MVSLEPGPQKVPVGGKERAVKASHGDAATAAPRGPPEKLGLGRTGPTASPLAVPTFSVASPRKPWEEVLWAGAPGADPHPHPGAVSAQGWVGHNGAQTCPYAPSNPVWLRKKKQG